MRVVSMFVLAGLASACATPGAGVSQRTAGVVITPEGNVAEPAWSEAESSQQVSLRNLRRSPEASFHLLRVNGQEAQPYVHENSDLVLMVVSGKLKLSLGRETLEAAAGDVIEVPRGTPIQSANLASSGASVAYLVFTPALEPSDRKPVSKETRESAWKWNLWPQ